MFRYGFVQSGVCVCVCVFSSECFLFLFLRMRYSGARSLAGGGDVGPVALSDCAGWLSWLRGLLVGFLS